MKKLLFGLIATVMFGFVGNAQNKFDYYLFNSVKDNPLDLTEEINEIYSNSLPNNQILKLINNKVGLQDNFKSKAYEYFNYDSYTMRENGLSDGVFNTNDINLIDEFVNNLKIKSFDQSLSSFEDSVLKLNLLENEFSKYNTFINIIKYLEYQDRTISTYASKKDWGCLIAIAQYTLETVAVGVACVPNPTTPIACPLAISFAVVGYANMINECKK
jgi:hypothetical protein